MILVPRQLRRSGLTGNVPYYGGRFTPAQAYAAAHPEESAAGRGPADYATTLVRAPVPTAAAEPAVRDTADDRDALEGLLLSGVLTQSEYDQLLARLVG